MQTITIADQEYEIVCNIGVLMEIQDKFGTLINFETGILGLKDTGRTGKDGKPIMRRTEPSIRMIYGILPAMLSAAGNPVDLADDALDFNIWDVADAMDEEFKGCFNRKNQQSLKTTEKAKKSKT